jgi:hypothetical protein
MSGWANHIEPTSGTRPIHNMGPRIKKSIGLWRRSRRAARG